MAKKTAAIAEPIEFYVMRRVRGKGDDVKVKTCETSEQAWLYLRSLGKDTANHYVQYSPGAMKQYEAQRRKLAKGGVVL